MKKRCTCICLALMMIVALCAFPVGASESVLPTIEQQPQNLVYPVGSVAIYSIEVSEEVDSCTWFLEYGDETYDLSKANGSQPWEAFITGKYGSNKDGNTYHYFFEGIEEGLAGSHIYAVVKQGTYELTSQKVMINLGGSAMPPSIHVPVEVEIELGGELGLLCVAKAPNGGLLSYTWYETSTGKIHDIIAIERGEAKDPTLYVDTSEIGVRYYVCKVETEQEGVGYSSVIPVKVVEHSATEVPTEAVDAPANDGEFPWWIIPLLLGAMAVGAVIAYLVTKKTIKK